MGLVLRKLNFWETTQGYFAHAEQFVHDKTDGLMSIQHARARSVLYIPTASILEVLLVQDTGEHGDIWEMEDVGWKYGNISNEGRQENLL